MYSKEVKEILVKSGYDPDWPISEDHILNLMQAAYNAGKNSKNKTKPPIIISKNQA